MNVSSIRRSPFAALALLCLLPLSAQAHTVWLQPDDAAAGQYRVYFGGHAGKLEPYESAKVREIAAYDGQGTSIAIARIDGGDGLRLKPARAPALIAVHYDNGIWTRTPQGRSVGKPMNEVPGATHAVRAVKYHKTILQWTPFVTQALNQPFELTPLDATAPRAGQPMRLRVTIDGKPAAGIRIARGEEGSDGVSDAQGIVSFVPEKGFNRIWSGQRSKVDDPAFTEFSYEYSLGFDAR